MKCHHSADGEKTACGRKVRHYAHNRWRPDLETHQEWDRVDCLQCRRVRIGKVMTALKRVQAVMPPDLFLLAGTSADVLIIDVNTHEVLGSVLILNDGGDTGVIDIGGRKFITMDPEKVEEAQSRYEERPADEQRTIRTGDAAIP